eukprot:10568386-Alexandrium_andersonii.AAC.1
MGPVVSPMSPACSGRSCAPPDHPEDVASLFREGLAPRLTSMGCCQSVACVCAEPLLDQPQCRAVAKVILQMRQGITPTALRNFFR